jgi:hypothetical protein
MDLVIKAAFFFPWQISFVLFGSAIAAPEPVESVPKCPIHREINRLYANTT